LVRERAEPLLLLGENIAQALQFVDRGGAELGIVALAQLVAPRRTTAWVIPATLHGPIRQQAVLLQPGAEHTAARALLAFLVSPECQALIRAAGYEVEE
jgi:molybdate transport system substrate-binding protein